METIISVLVIAFVVGVIFYVEMFMCKPLLDKEIFDYQRKLDRISIKSRVDYGLELYYDAKTELLESQNQKKAFALIFAGTAISLSFIISVFLGILSLTNIMIICISAIMLICYGIIKMSESKKLAIGLLIFIFILGTLAKIFFDKMMEMSPYAYFYLCGIIVLISIFSLFSQTKIKKA